MKVKYTAHATATGGRVDGHSETDDGKVSVNLSHPKELGGDGGPGTNPEQLFAVGISACFLGAMRVAAGRDHKKLPPDATVTAAISFVDREDGVGNTIAAELTARVAGLSTAEVEDLMKRADQICPYAHVLRNGGDLKLSAG